MTVRGPSAITSQPQGHEQVLRAAMRAPTATTSCLAAPATTNSTSLQAPARDEIFDFKHGQDKLYISKAFGFQPSRMFWTTSAPARVETPNSVSTSTIPALTVRASSFTGSTISRRATSSCSNRSKGRSERTGGAPSGCVLGATHRRPAAMPASHAKSACCSASVGRSATIAAASARLRFACNASMAQIAADDCHRP